MGKTAVWIEAVADAQRRGYRVLQARPAQSETQLSYSGRRHARVEARDQTRRHLDAPS